METIKNEEVNKKKIVEVSNHEYDSQKISQKIEQHDITQAKERESADLELVYKTVLLNLREKFPTIPEDLTNKRINIRYKGENGTYRNIFLSANEILLTGIRDLSIHKFGESWEASASSRKGGRGTRGIQLEMFGLGEFINRIDDIIENADKCEIYIEDLNR